MVKANYVMDIETMVNCFQAYFESVKDEDLNHSFIVHHSINDLPALISFLEGNIEKGEWHISFNGLAFDSQVIHWILDNKRKLLKMTGDEAARAIYAYAQSVIGSQIRNAFQDYPPWKLKIKQIDLFKMNHWDNPAKSSSLKWIQYSMDWHNVEEMPIHHTTEIHTEEEINLVLNYCKNDVKSTKAILFLSKEQVDLRAALSRQYDIDLYSASEPRIAKELFAHFLSEKLGIDKKELKALRTPRETIIVKDLILPNIKFKTHAFNKILEYFQSKTILGSETKGALKYQLDYRGVKTDYGMGGVHGCRDAGIYEEGNGMIIMSSDVTSFYPNLAIRNGFHPAHILKKAFLEQYEWFFDQRKLIPKSDPRNYVYKIILNSTYGLSNDANSYLYDPLMTFSITINGQLQLSMLYEMLAEGIPGSIPLMQNTDGLEMMIPAHMKDTYLTICKEWETLTMLELEHDQYKKMIIRDVNNYIAINEKGKVKCKGAYDWEDLDKKKVAVLHKNKSFLVIPKAIYEYFVNGIKPEDYLEQNKNIFDYCAGTKAKGEWQMEAFELGEDDNEHSILKKIPLQKLNRYHISNEGTKLMKTHPDGRNQQIEAGKWKQTVCNNIEETLSRDFETLDINKNYYLSQIYKEINNIDSKVSKGFVQMSLF